MKKNTVILAILFVLMLVARVEVSGKSRQVHEQVVEFITKNLSAWGGKVKKN